MATAFLPILFSRSMSVEEFASFRFVSFILGLLSIVGSLGFDASMYALICRHNRSARSFSKNAMLWGIICGLTISTLGFVSLGFLPGSIQHLLSNGVFLPMSSCLILMMATAHIEHLLVTLNLHKNSAAVAGLTSVLLAAACLIGLWHQASASSIVWSMSAVYGIRFAATAGYHLIEAKDHRWLNLELFREQIQFGLASGLSNILMSFQRLDRIAVAGRFSPSEFANYSVGSFEIPLSRSYCESQHQVATVATLRSDTSQSMRIWWSHIIRSVRLILPLAAIFSFYSTQLVELLFGLNYLEAGRLFSMACLSLVIFALDPELLLRSKGYARTLTAIHGFSLLAFFSVFLLPVVRPMDILLTRLVVEAGACLAKYSAIYYLQWFRNAPFTNSSTPCSAATEMAT
jgi:O-antigen/teichoic acid export membrane protein